MSEKWEEKQYAPTFLGAWRDATGATQEEMADAIGISNGHLSKLELGKRQYTQEILEKARDFIGGWFTEVSVCDLIHTNPKDFVRPAPGEKARAQMIENARRVPAQHWELAARILAGMKDNPPEPEAPQTKNTSRVSSVRTRARRVR